MDPSIYTPHQRDTMDEDWAWLDPALRPQPVENMEAANAASMPTPSHINMETINSASIPVSAPVMMDPANVTRAAPPVPEKTKTTKNTRILRSAAIKTETVNHDKVPLPDYSQAFDSKKLSDLWFANQNPELNILGAMNACQAHYDGTTFWDRDERNGYINHQMDDPNVCLIARQNSINNIATNNKMYLNMDDYYTEQKKAYDNLFAYNSTKFSKETIHGAYRQSAAKRGAANRRANNKHHEAVVVGIIDELAALRDDSGVLDEKYKQRFDRLAKEIVAATKVKMTPEINGRLAPRVAPGTQG